MAQADSFDFSNGSGQELINQMNEAALAGATSNSGHTPPPDPKEGMPWWNYAVFSRRSENNAWWDYYESYGWPDPPGVQNNEAAGYPVGAKVVTLTGDVYFHRGGGVWREVGTGDGTVGGGGSTFGVHLVGLRRIEDISGIDMVGLRRVEEV